MDSCRQKCDFYVHSVQRQRQDQLERDISSRRPKGCRTAFLAAVLLLPAVVVCIIILQLVAHPTSESFNLDNFRHTAQASFLPGFPHVFRSVPFPVSPADSEPDLFEWRVRQFNSGFDADRTTWQGRPNESTNQAWENLYRNVGITTVDRSTSDKLPDSTLEFPGLQGRFLVGIAMFHQLHCLDMVRRAMYPETRMDDMMEHVEHCLDQLRQVVMCSGDLSTVSWAWDVEKDIPVSKFDTRRVCRDFDAIHHWASQISLTEARFNQLLREQGHNTLG